MANSVYAADLDGDGDMDVLSASTSSSKLTYHDRLVREYRRTR